MIRRNFKKILYIEFRATLNFRKFKVALNYAGDQRNYYTRPSCSKPDLANPGVVKILIVLYFPFKKDFS